MTTQIEMSEMLKILRQGVGNCGWGADKHTTNHFKVHVWFKAIPGGYTECCEWDDECDYHKRIRGS